MRIDLNSDLGESFGPWPMGQDAALMESITSANVACGFHAGDPNTMHRLCMLAKEQGVSSDFLKGSQVFGLSSNHSAKLRRRERSMKTTRPMAAQSNA